MPLQHSVETQLPNIPDLPYSNDKTQIYIYKIKHFYELKSMFILNHVYKLIRIFQSINISCFFSELYGNCVKYGYCIFGIH